MAWVVQAPLVVSRTTTGRVQHLERGDVVPDDTTEETIDHLKDLGFIAEVEDAPKPKATRKSSSS